MFVDGEMQARQRELAEAQARPARARQLVSYQGRNWTTVTISLGVYFLEEPTFSWGCRIVDGQSPTYAAMNAMAYVTDYLTPDEDTILIDKAVVALSANATAARYLRFSLTFEGPAMYRNAGLFAEEG